MRYQDLKANLTKRYNAAVRLYEAIATDHEAVLDQLRGGCPNARHQLQEYVDALQCETVHLHNAHAARAAAIPELDEGIRLREEQQFPEIREKVYELLSKITDATVTLLSNLKATKVEEEKPPQLDGSENDSDQMDDQAAEDPATRAPVTDNQLNYSNLNASYVPEDAGPGSAPAGIQQNVAHHQMQARFDSRNPFLVPEEFPQNPTTPSTVPTRRIPETTTYLSPSRTFPYLPPAESARRTEQTPRTQDARWTTTPRTPGRVEWADDYGDFQTPMTHLPTRTSGMRTFTIEEDVPRQPMQPAALVHGMYPARNSARRTEAVTYVRAAANHVPTGTLVDIGPDSVPRNDRDGLQGVTQGMQRLTTAEIPYTMPVGRYVNQHTTYGPSYAREHAEPVIEHVGNHEQAYALPRRTRAEPAADPVFLNEGRNFRPHIDPPKIRLPTFHGRRGEDWNKFSSLFKAVIHNRRDISDEEKLWYLIGCLQNEASNVISGLSYTAECYPIAMQLLEERYGDRDEAKVKLVEELRRLRNGSKADGYAYYDKLMSIVNQLRSLGTNTEEEPLRVLIDDTVPHWIRQYVDQERLREPAWTTAKLLETIRRVVHLFNNRRDADFPITTIPATNSPSSRHSKPRRQQQSQQQPPQQQSPPQQQPRRSDKSRNHSTPWNRDASRSAATQQNSRTPATQHTPQKNRPPPRAAPVQNHSDVRMSDVQCYKCGQPGHLSRFCKKGQPSRTNTNAVYEQIEDAPPTVQLTSAEQDVDLETPLPIAQALVVNPTTGRRVKTLVFLDTGSQKDYVSDALVDALDLPKSEERMLTVNGFLGMKTSMHAATTTLLIEDRDGLKTEVTATCVERPVNPLNIMRVAEDGKTIISHVGIPSIVLGNNTSWTFIKGMSKKAVGGFKCLDSTLGLLLTGQRANFEEVTVAVADARFFDRYIEDWNSLETIGITDPMNDDEDMRTWEMLKSTIRLEDGRYVVSLPFKDESPSMPTNLGLCKKQTVALRARMLASETMRLNADKIIEEWLRDEVIEELSYDEVKNPTGIITVYSPFHLVTKKDSTTTPYRMVHNASAHLRGAPALNKLLARGPVLLPDLVGMLLRFREAQTVAITDVKKAFLQLVIDEPCRDALRFLYVKDWKKPITDDNLRHFRFRRLNFGLISSPFLLAGVLKIHFEAQGQVGKELLRNVYVDNIVVGGEDASEVAEKMEFAQKTFKEIGMELSQYFSNDPELQNTLGQEKDAGKFLGIPWKTSTDKMIYEFAAVQVNEKSTKRSVLSDVCSWYDPLGYAYPVILHWKLLIQKMWKKGCSWDSPLEKELVEEAKKLGDWKICFSIPREICRGQEVRLVIFTDASLNAFAACAYFVAENQPPRLILARARLCPLKGTPTVPRLELLGVLIGTRLATFVRTHTSKKIISAVLFTDSTIVLSWIGNTDANVPVFNKRRLEEIRKCDTDFRYVPTEMNPADVATRGLSPAELNRCRLWWNGPEFLTAKEWPRFERDDAPKITERAEEEATPAEETVTAAANSRSRTSDDIIDVQKYRTFKKALNVNFYVMLFLKKCSRGRIAWDPMKMAQLRLLKQIQNAEPPSTKQIKQLNLFKDDDELWRSRGRIGGSDLSDDAKTPIFIPKNEKAAGLVEDAHRESGHGSVAATLAMMRQKYWMPKCRSFIQRILKECPHCRRRKPTPFALPTPPHLPPERVRESTPFAHVGVDLAGPFRVRMETSGEHVKRWFLLVTCLASRAVHLEILEGLSSTQFLRGFRRFVARRGRPLTVLSDNGTNFHGALPVMVQWKEEGGGDTSYCEQLKLKWKFIPAMSPWNGGAYERLIGAVKSTLRKTVPRKILSNDEFHTFVVEAEAIVNSRPLLYDDNESRVLRPIDLIQPGCKPGIPVTGGEQEEFGEQDIILAWSNAKERVRLFWEQWTREYLPSLRERYRTSLRQHRPLHRQPCAGEVVLIHDEHNPPACWKLGRIVELHGSRDGEIRSATVKTANGRTISRSIALLHPLEMSPAPTAAEDQETDETEGPVVDQKLTDDQADKQQTTSPVVPRHNYNLRSRNAGIYFVVTLLSLLVDTSAQCLPTGEVALRNPLNHSLYTICRHFNETDGCAQNPCACKPGEVACQMSERNSNLHSWTALMTGEHRPHWFPSHEDDVSTMKNFNFIRTADGRRHLFKDLAIRIRQADPSKPYTCIGQGLPHGDEEYCRRYPCSLNGTNYCVMGHVEQYYMHTVKGDLPVSAYGTQYSIIYEKSIKIPEQERTCEEWQPRCNADGTITLTIQRKITQNVQICVEHRCQMVTASNGTTIHPPRSMRLRNTTYELDCKDSHNPHSKEFTCAPAKKCLLIRCLFCKEAWHNLECVQGSIIVVIFVAFFITMTILLLEFAMGKCGPNTRPTKAKRRNVAIAKDDEIEMIPFRPRQFTQLAVAVLVVVMFKPAEGCGEAVSLTAMSSHCLTTPEQRNCSFFESTMVTARTRSTSCILLKDNRGEVMEHLEIKAELRHRCIPRTLYWTLPTTLSTLTVRRCPSAGSCQADFCSRTQWNTSIPEFGDLNLESGITLCEQAEGCITNGCFYCSPGCRFSKTTMLHSNSTPTEITFCTWTKEIYARISTQSGLLTQLRTIVGAPGTSILDGRITISATNFVSDVDENLPKMFGHQDQRTFIIPERDSKLAELVRCHHGKTDGQLRCTLNEEHVEFKTTDDMIHTHPEGNEELFYQMANTELPRRYDELLIADSSSGIMAYGEGAVSMQVDVKGYTASVDTEMNLCTITILGVTGCANCRQGARIEYNCSTSFGHPQLAVATCASTTFTASCGNGIPENTHATISTAEVNEKCSLRCPGGTQSFQLQASLTYLEDYDEHWKFTDADEKKEVNVVTDFIDSIFSSMADYVKKTIITIFILFIVYVIIRIILFVAKYL